MALIIKNYTLFYLKNQHPNIPSWADYQAIDDARIFQKYVWAWFEKTSKSWLKALKATENEIILYNWYIPILPYFNCSPWFTFSAKEKFWWLDTPWLQSKLDFYKCKTFKWHWVWLSWKWAEILAKKWLNYKQILKRYFDGIKIVKIY
jgi:peptidoglycan hydrolase-like amidase